MTCNEDASVLWAAEGGTVAFMDSTSDNGMSNEIKREQVGSLAVLACDMILDPDAEITNVTTLNTEAPNYLYVAGGRHGLWAMEADPRPGEDNRAILIDDTGSDQTSNKRASRRWCNGVDTITVDMGQELKTFLVASFAKKRGNRVRFYPLDRVRQSMDTVADHSSWSTDLEFDYIEPMEDPEVSSIRIPFNQAVGPVPAGTPNEVSFAYSFGMAVDDHDPTEPYVYVALGIHGLVRIAVTPNGSGGLDGTVEAGPYFGDDTPYYANLDVGYGHMEMFREGELEAAHRERPLFMDVAVESLSGVTYVYAAVDHLGWVKFVSSPWGPAATIRHHEGTRTVYNTFSAPRDLIGASLDDVNSAPTYAHRIEVLGLNNGNPIPGVDPVVLVTATTEPSRAWLGMANEGRALDYTGGDQGKIPRPVYPQYAATTGQDVDHYTGIYRDFGGDWLNAGLGNSSTDPVDFLDEGGFYAHAPYGQTDAQPFRFFTGEMVVPPIGGEPNDGKFSVTRREWDWLTQDYDPLAIYQRLNADRPGRWCWDVAPMLPDPTTTTIAEENFLLTSGNDASMKTTGMLYFDASGELTELDESEANGEYTFGIVFSPTAQWLDPGGSPQDRWIFGAGKLTPTSPTYFALRRIRLRNPSNPSNPAWDEREEYVFRAPEDYFGREAYYARGHVDASFDAVTGGDYLFITIGGSHQSIYIVDRPDLINEVRGSTQADLNEEDFLLGVSGLPLDEVHREMDNFYLNPPDPTDAALRKRLREGLRIGALGAAQPRFIQLPGGRNILAVPAWTSVADVTQEDFVTTQSWHPPQVWIDNFTKLFVRLYQVEEVLGQVQLTAMPTVFGPDTLSSTIRIEVVQLTPTTPPGAPTRTFMLIADFQGALVVHELTDLDSWTAGAGPPEDEPRHATFARWDTPLSISDDLTANLYGLDVDVQGSRAVLYLGAWRHGVQVVEFDPFDQVDGDGTFGGPGTGEGEYFFEWDAIQTTYHASSGIIQPAGANNNKRLIVPDGGVGIRVYEAAEVGGEQ